MLPTYTLSQIPKEYGRIVKESEDRGENIINP
jgi:hypothetical protein